MKPLTYFFIVLFVFGLGCMNSKRVSWTVIDTWYKAPQEKRLQPYGWPEMAAYEVIPSFQKKAQLLLRKKQVIRITPYEARLFLGRDVLKEENQELYLIRGVFLNEGTGDFSIYAKDKRVWVCHGSLGNAPVPMKRKALVVSLEHVPEELFVTCIMDE